MSPNRRRRKSEPQTDLLDDAQNLADELELEAEEVEARNAESIESDENGLEEEEDLVEVRLAVGPDGLLEAWTPPPSEEEEPIFIERDEKL